MQWHYAKDGESVGPLEVAEFDALVASGEVSAATLVWRPDLAEWTPYGKLVPAAPAPQAGAETPPAKETACSVCGNVFAEDDMITHQGAYVCAGCKPEFFQRLKEGAELPGIMNCAGFWIRFVAKFVDGIILGAVNMVVSVASAALGLAASAAGSEKAMFAVQAVLFLVQIAIQAAYTVFFLGRFGATPGKMACRLKVVRASGDPIGYGRAFGRYFAELLSGMPTLCIGYLMIAFDDEKRGLHDRICDTRVIRRG